jgi:Outer membrane protein beta-barrel domain
MKKQVRAIALVAFSIGASALCATNAVAQRYDDNRTDDRRRMEEQYDRRDDKRDERSRENDVDMRIERRREFNTRKMDEPRYDNDYRGRSSRQSYRLEDLSKAYDEGFDDGQKSFEKQQKEERREDYKNFTFGIYAGANSTRFQGETIDTDGNGSALAGRLGYQAGFFVRGGGRLFGQIGAEYQTSSSEFFRPGDGASIEDIRSNIDQKYLHVPAYVGVKLAQSERGVSGIRLQVGAELATPLGGNNSVLNLQRSDFNDATLNGLANIGFDAGPLLIDFVYHHGFQNVLRDNTSGSQRRVLGVNLGFKF